MREFAKISPQFWISEQGRKIKKLGLAARVVAYYLLTSPHSTMIGIYYLPIAFIAHETGIDFSDVVEALEELFKIDFCSYDHGTEYVWVRDMAFTQIGVGLKESDNRVKGFQDALESLPTLSFTEVVFNKYREAFYLDKSKLKCIDAPLEPLTSKDKEKEKEERKEKVKEEEKINNIIISENKNIQLIDDEDLKFENLSIKEQSIKILRYFNETIRTNYLPDEHNLQFIIKALHDGITPEQCCYVISNKNHNWGNNEVMKEYLKLEILFGKKIKKYVAELRQPISKVMV